MLPADFKDEVKYKVRGFGYNFILRFPGRDEAELALKMFERDKPEYTDKMDGKRYPLRFHRDKPRFVRSRDKVVGNLWQPMRKAIIESKKHDEFKLGQSNGTLYVIDDDIPTRLFTISRVDKDDDDEPWQVKPMLENLATYGVDEDTARRLAEAAPIRIFRP